MKVNSKTILERDGAGILGLKLLSKLGYGFGKDNLMILKCVELALFVIQIEAITAKHTILIGNIRVRLIQGIFEVFFLGF